MTFEKLFPNEVYPQGVLPEMIDESQYVTEGGVAGSGAGASVGAVDGLLPDLGHGLGRRCRRKR